MWRPSADREGWVRTGLLAVATVLFAAAALVWLGRPAQAMAHRALVASALLVAGSGLLYRLTAGGSPRHQPLALVAIGTVLFAATACLWMQRPSDLVARWAVVPAALLIVLGGLLQAIATGGLCRPSPLHRPHWLHRHPHPPRRR